MIFRQLFSQPELIARTDTAVAPQADKYSSSYEVQGKNVYSGSVKQYAGNSGS